VRAETVLNLYRKRPQRFTNSPGHPDRRLSNGEWRCWPPWPSMN